MIPEHCKSWDQLFQNAGNSKFSNYSTLKFEKSCLYNTRASSLSETYLYLNSVIFMGPTCQLQTFSQKKTSLYEIKRSREMLLKYAHFQKIF